MTFLEYLCYRLLHEPVSGTCWRCPYCDSSGGSFSISARTSRINRNTRKPYPVKFKCFRCGKWGDEFDLHKLFNPTIGYSQRCYELQLLRKEFDQHTTSLHQGERNLSTMTHLTRAEQEEIQEAALDQKAEDATIRLVNYLRKQGFKEPSQLLPVLKAVEKALAICEEKSLRPAAFAGNIGFTAWGIEGEQEHLAECDDADCDWECCIRARGITGRKALKAECERIDRLHRNREQEKQRRMSKVRRKVKSAVGRKL